MRWVGGGGGNEETGGGGARAGCAVLKYTYRDTRPLRRSISHDYRNLVCIGGS